jgi:hypothetical protein
VEDPRHGNWKERAENNKWQSDKTIVDLFVACYSQQPALALLQRWGQCPIDTSGILFLGQD